MKWRCQKCKRPLKMEVRPHKGRTQVFLVHKEEQDHFAIPERVHNGT